VPVGEALAAHLLFVMPGGQYCSAVAEGSLLSSGGARDAAAFTAQYSIGCTSPEDAYGGTLGHVTVGTPINNHRPTLTATFAPDLLLGTPGWCVYDVKKIAMRVDPPIISDALNEFSAPLDSKLSLGTDCAASKGFALEVRLTTLEEEQIQYEGL
jgi:hypothetical protein